MNYLFKLLLILIPEQNHKLYAHCQPHTTVTLEYGDKWESTRNEKYIRIKLDLNCRNNMVGFDGTDSSVTVMD